MTKRFGHIINHIEEGLMATFLAFMTLLTAIQVVLRYGFNTGLIWSLEATTYAFAWLVLLGMAYGVRTRSHIAVDLVMSRLHGRTLQVATTLALLICVAYAVLMLYGGSVLVWRLIDLGNEARDLPIKRWILTSMIPIGFGLLAFRFLQLGWRFFQGDLERLQFGQHETPASIDIELPASREKKP
jgi:C4-dicarboxylate transporter DctQ subunit